MRKTSRSALAQGRDDGSAAWACYRLRDSRCSSAQVSPGMGSAQQVTHRGRLPRTDRFGGTSRCGSLTVRDVSFGGAWPGSRIRYDEGGHSRRAAARHRWSRTSEYFAPELSSAATLGFTLIGSVTWRLALPLRDHSPSNVPALGLVDEVMIGDDGLSSLCSVGLGPSMWSSCGELTRPASSSAMSTPSTTWAAYLVAACMTTPRW